MKTEKYQVEIPKVLSDLVGPQIVREQIGSAIHLIFEAWAKDALVARIKVTKPRVTREEAAE